MDRRGEPDAPPANTSLRTSTEAVRNAALAKARNQLKCGKKPDEVLAFLANAITNKFLHAPTARLRDAAMHGDKGFLQAVQRLFAHSTSEP